MSSDTHSDPKVSKITDAVKSRKIDNLTIIVIILFILLLLSLGIVISGVVLPYQKEVGSLLTYFVFVFVIFHSVKTIGVKKGVYFIGLSVVSALIGEYGATSRGWFFGHYVFADVPYKILGVPFERLLLWAISIYLAYCMTNLIFRGYNSDVSRTLTYGIVPLLAAIDSILVMNVKMVIDPIAVGSKTVSYTNIAGEYFGIPVFAIFSWYFMSFLVVSIFRFYELRCIKTKKFDPSIKSQLLGGTEVRLLDVMPSLVYLIWALIPNGVLAFTYKHNELVLIGFAAMVPSVIIALMAYHAIYGKQH